MPTQIGTVSTKGQVTVPKDIRAALHIRAGDKLLFDLEGGDRALVRKAESQRLTAILDRLGPTKETGVEMQRRLRREWTRRDRRH
ncbi:MAG: AbrB/MazE/SpoVT family DNA-binding domain-containing protein [Thermoplasmata archaeon]|nr:AbrB/MazE/SpoVT family DNA-binding domain-containing protein [Thermoplasmata archaeon]